MSEKEPTTEEEERLRRIAACVNACRGLKTESLESISRMIDSSECRLCGEPEAGWAVHAECLCAEMTKRHLSPEDEFREAWRNFKRQLEITCLDPLRPLVRWMAARLERYTR